MSGYPGKQGRKPKASTIVEKLRDKKTTNGNSIPRPPEYLSDHAKDTWKRITKILKDTGMVTKRHADAMALLCTLHERWLQAEEHLKEEGLVIMTPNGCPQISPYLTIANKTMEQMTKMLSEFGMTPASETRMPIPIKDDSVRRLQNRPIETVTKDPRDYLNQY